MSACLSGGCHLHREARSCSFRRASLGEETRNHPYGILHPDGRVLRFRPPQDPAHSFAQTGDVSGQLSQWPVQLRLVPASAPYLENCDLLLASDCSAFACGNFHERFIKGRIVLIGCPKLDPAESWKKLSDIVAQHSIRSITVTRMEVPCCSGLANAAVSAVEKSGKNIPVKVFTVYPDGNVREN